MAPTSTLRVCLAGFLGTFAVTLALYPAFVYGIPKLDFATLFGTWLMRKTAEPLSMTWWIGMAEHFFNGSILFPVLYLYGGYRLLRGGRFMRGLQWGGMIWLLVQFLSMPLMGLGFFSMKTAEPGLYLLATLFAYGTYGVLFGITVGGNVEPATADEPLVEEPIRDGMKAAPPQRREAA